MGIKIQFAVDMVCQSCVDDVSRVLAGVDGVERFDVSLADQQAVVEGTARPSAVLRAIKESGRAAVVRGAGSSASGNIGAAVCILEDKSGPQGLARFVQVSDDLCYVDISISGIADGTHAIGIHECGDLSSVPESCGARWGPDGCGGMGDIAVQSGRGELAFETDRFKVWEVIGRSIVVAAQPAALAGVIARSAGLFENDKQVCACSGHTLWEESRLVGEGHRL
ncbi:copper chaperone [Coemansia nantahalensis]|nr:copper chaperone [Coemansia nantahalensis]